MASPEADALIGSLVAGDADRAARAKAEKDQKDEQKKQTKTMKKLDATLLILYSWVKKVVGASKIVSAVLGTLVKLFGLLIDLILLPLLPLLIGALMFLAETIMKIPGIGPAAVETPGVTAGKEIAGKGALGIDIPSLVAIIFGVLAGALVAIEAAALLGISIGPLAIALTAIIYGIMAYILVQIAYKWGDMAAGILKDWWMGAAAWLKMIWGEFLKGVDNAIKWVTDGFVNLFLLIIDKITDVVDIFKTIGDWSKGAVSGVGNLWGLLGSKQSGGEIGQTGPYLLHKGETVTPAGKAGDIHLHITGTLFKNEEDLYKNVVDRLRKDQWRYNA